MISVPLPRRAQTLRLMPPGQPVARSGSLAARADALLDEVFIALAHDEVTRGVLRLLHGLAELRADAPRAEWRRVTDEIWPRHPVRLQFLDRSVRDAAMRAGGPRAGLATLLSLLGERPPARGGR